MIEQLAINDCSPDHGGYTPDHSGHETGLQVDIKTPRKNKGHGGISVYLGVTDNNKNVSEKTGRETFTQTHPSYDRDANRQILKSIRKVMSGRIEGLYLNDFVLIDEGLCTYCKGHYDHIHLTIKPPEREMVSSTTSTVVTQNPPPPTSTPPPSNPPTQTELYNFYRDYIYPLSDDPNKFTDVDGHINICGIRGWKAGIACEVENNFNQYNDIIALIWKDGSNHYVKEFIASVDPGKRRNLPNEKGLAHLMAKNSSAGTTGQYTYEIGKEGGKNILKQKQTYVSAWREKNIQNLEQNVFTNQVVDTNVRGIHFIPGDKYDVVGSISYGQQTIRPRTDYSRAKRFEDANWKDFIETLEAATELGSPQTEFIYTLMTGSDIPNLNSIDWGAAWTLFSNSWDWVAGSMNELYEKMMAWMLLFSPDSDTTTTFQPLKSGDKGEDVRDLQRGLISIDADQGVSVNGTFDGATKSRVKAVQRKFGWSETGIADSKFLEMFAWVIGSEPKWTHLDSSYASLDITPSTTVTSNSTTYGNVLADIWNDFGGLINEISKDSKISPRIICAILAKETSGKFVTSTPSTSSAAGKPNTRFENHIFFDVWGMKSTTKTTSFNEFFEPQEGWQNHKFNTGTASSPNWITLHTSPLSQGPNQERQWLAIAKAEQIATEAAAYGSASYGGPQIMGSNYSKVGYDSAKEFAEALEGSSTDPDTLKPHIFALFDYLRSNYWRYHGNLFVLTEEGLPDNSTLQYKVQDAHNSVTWNRWEYFGYLYNGKLSYGIDIRDIVDIAGQINIPMEGS